MRPSILAASGGAILASALAVAPANVTAQEAEEAQEQAALEEITVTGSRIPRQDFTANSPVTTLDAATFETTSTIGVETVLNQLPQFVPAVTQFTTTDVQQTATNTVGASTVSLRGLGTNRNLVLLNGRRAIPVDASMAIDTNTIPASAIARVEVISGGASAVYGADAVGGVVNFVLKDDFEGAQVDVKFGDSFDGGNQEVTISGLIGANVAGDRGNVMLGVERSSRSLVQTWERDWRVENMRNPSAPATAFFWGTDTWISINAFNAGPPGALPSQAAVDALFDQAGGAVPNNVRMLVNRNSGTLYTGLMDEAGAAGSYRYEGPYLEDPDGNFQGLPFRVIQPNGNIKENNFWQWSSIPLERLSAFANGHFDVSDSVRVTAQALVSRNETETSLGLTADNITFWGANIPFGNDPYLGNPAAGIPNPLNLDGTTNAAYLPGGTYGLDCEAAPSAAAPWNDGLPGCTQSEAWPVTPEIWNLYRTRDPAFQDADLWANRPPDYLRDALGAARSSTNTTTTMQLSLGAEGELPSGNDFWDVTFSTGQTDNLAIQRGSTRLSTYRALMASPNYGRNALFDPNAFSFGFAESIATCESGLPIIDTRAVTNDCAVMLSPDLKNKREVTQTVFEANIVGDLVEMPAGQLGYALGATYRENSYSFEPDNLSQNQNFIDPIAGLFPNEDSFGEYDVSEIYGELLIPIVSGSPVGDFSLELGGRLSDWSMPQVDQVTTYKALIDWAMTPRYRLRGGFNRALRAPNLGELFSGRTQIFGGVPSQFGDQCSELNVTGPFSVGNPNISQEQRDQSRAICEAKMGTLGAQNYYINNALTQPVVGTVGIQNGTGNPNLREEAADTFTLGMVMDFHENWSLIVDYYSIEIEDMIAIESGDAVYERCLSVGFNPTGDINAPGCVPIFRNPSSGAAANIDLTYSNLGYAKMEGIDLQLNWSRMLANGGFNMNMIANYVLSSETQDRADLAVTDWAGTDGCSLQIDCQGYDYRVFTTLNYFRGDWNVSLRHQFWPAIDDATCITAPQGAGCRDGGVQESYQLLAATASYTFSDQYTLRFGIDNLLDVEPPCVNPNPDNAAYPIPCVRGQGFDFDGATYDPLGRRAFVSMTMEF